MLLALGSRDSVSSKPDVKSCLFLFLILKSSNDWREVCDTGILLIFQLAEEAYYDIDYMISPSQTQSVIIKAGSVRDSKSSLNTCAQVMLCVVRVCVALSDRDPWLCVRCGVKGRSNSFSQASG